MKIHRALLMKLALGGTAFGAAGCMGTTTASYAEPHPPAPEQTQARPRPVPNPAYRPVSVPAPAPHAAPEPKAEQVEQAPEAVPVQSVGTVRPHECLACGRG